MFILFFEKKRTKRNFCPGNFISRGKGKYEGSVQWKHTGANYNNYEERIERMEQTSKQRAQLRGIANTIDTIVIIGKDGITENLVKQADDALEAREIIKCKVLENSMLTAREACDELSRLTRSEQVQVIGTKFVLYRTSFSKEKDKRIQLVRR